MCTFHNWIVSMTNTEYKSSLMYVLRSCRAVYLNENQLFIQINWSSLYNRVCLKQNQCGFSLQAGFKRTVSCCEALPDYESVMISAWNLEKTKKLKTRRNFSSLVLSVITKNSESKTMCVHRLHRHSKYIDFIFYTWFIKSS